MKLFVFTAGFYDRDYEEKLEKLKYSCGRFGVDLHIYGRGSFFSFFDSKINQMGILLNGIKDRYTHALYTDASDSFFLSTEREIINKFLKFETKLLVSGEKSCHPFSSLKDAFPDDGSPWRYMNPGNFIGEIPYVLDLLSKMKAYTELKTNDQGHWMEAYAQGHLKDMKIDTNCEIFQTMSDCHFENEFEFDYHRIRNCVTDTHPCLVHFNGPKDTVNVEHMNIVYKKLRGGGKDVKVDYPLINSNTL